MQFQGLWGSKNSSWSQCHVLRPKAAGSQGIYLEGGFLLFFFRKGKEGFGLMPRSQNHKLRVERALKLSSRNS
jgi:hypothetical protein